MITGAQLDAIRALVDAAALAADLLLRVEQLVVLVAPPGSRPMVVTEIRLGLVKAVADLRRAFA